MEKNDDRKFKVDMFCEKEYTIEYDADNYKKVLQDEFKYILDNYSASLTCFSKKPFE